MGVLREKQKRWIFPQHSIVQDAATRWNSTYFMYKRLTKQRWAVYALIHDEQMTSSSNRHLDLKPDQWDLLNQLLAVFKPLQVATTALSKAQNTLPSIDLPCCQWSGYM